MAFSVSWDAYKNNICHGLSALQQQGRFVDMTIAADGHHVKVHQMVMALVSPYIQELIFSAACPHPVIFLNKISYDTLQSILQYAYTGEVLVTRDKINEFLLACKSLHIRGVEGLNSSVPELEVAANSYPESYNETDTSQMDTSGRNMRSHAVSQENDACYVSEDDNEKMDTAYDNNDEDETPGPLQSLDTLPTTAKQDISMMTLQYTVSMMGNIQLVCNRYLYFLMSSRKSGERMWRCFTYKRTGTCRAFLVTKDNKIIKRVGAHNHPYHDKQILKRFNNGNMFSALNEVENHIENMKQHREESNEPDPTGSDYNTSEPQVLSEPTTVIVTQGRSRLLAQPNLGNVYMNL